MADYNRGGRKEAFAGQAGLDHKITVEDEQHVPEHPNRQPEVRLPDPIPDNRSGRASRLEEDGHTYVARSPSVHE